MVKKACIPTNIVGYIPRSIIFTDWSSERKWNSVLKKIFKGKIFRQFRTHKWLMKENSKNSRNLKIQKNYKKDK